MQKRKKLLLIIGIVLALVAIVIWLLMRGDSKKPQGSGQDTASTTSQPSSNAGTLNQQGTSQNQSDTAKQSNTAPPSTATLEAPSGSFISNHHPSSATQSIESICSTNQGASCQFTFRLGSTVKALSKKTVGSNGSVSWVWTPSEVGLTSGTWEVTAVAELNGTQKSTTDPLGLVISP